MMSLGSPTLWTVAAVEAAEPIRQIEFDLPETSLGWLLWLGGAALIVGLSVWGYLRDTRPFSPTVRIWLTGLRVAVLASLFIIAVNPHERTQRVAYRPSRAAILVDTSLSMRHPGIAVTAESGSAAAAVAPSRTEMVRTLLAESNLIERLRRDHEVSVYAFDSALTGPLQLFPQQRVPVGDSGENEPDETPDAAATRDVPSPRVDWDALLEPQGMETRLGESLMDLIRQIGGRTLSGIVVISDGASNAGVEPATTRDVARGKQVRLLTVGVGSTASPANIQVAKVVAPTDVQLGDAFELTVLVTGQGTPGERVKVILTRQAGTQDRGDVEVVDTAEVVLPDEDGVPTEVTFSQLPSFAEEFVYKVKAEPVQPIRDANPEDDVAEHQVTVFDRPTRVLVVAGGPMRDYRFVRNMLYRHPSIDVDVWLQTGQPGISQESNNLLFAFPDRTELFEYDVVIGFDPDWKTLTFEQSQMLADWVSNEAGGLILVAGNVHTPALANATEEGPELLRALYPVVLTSYFTDFLDHEAVQPRQIEWTRDGEQAGFLQIADDPTASQRAWTTFPGIYSCLPTDGPKAAATVYGYYPDPNAQTEYGYPIFLASQFYGEGRVLYVGSGELWRLRSIDEDLFDRFWVKATREVGQGRMKRGTKRGTLLLERNQYVLGQTVNLRARLLDSQYRPLTDANTEIEIYDPNGRPVLPGKVLTADPRRPGEYVGNFRAGVPGRYRLEIPLPESNERLTANVAVQLPRLEDEVLEQDVRLLRNLADETGGKYFTVETAVEGIPAELPNRGEEFLVDERLRSLWDQAITLYLLVGLLGAEWLTRKLLKLA